MYLFCGLGGDGDDSMDVGDDNSVGAGGGDANAAVLAGDISCGGG